MYGPGARGLERVSDPLELKSQMLLFCFVFEAGSLVARAELELLSLPPPSSKFWHCRGVPPCLIMYLTYFY